MIRSASEIVFKSLSSPEIVVVAGTRRYRDGRESEVAVRTRDVAALRWLESRLVVTEVEVTQASGGRGNAGRGLTLRFRVRLPVTANF